MTVKTSASTVIVEVNSENKDLQSVIDDLYQKLFDMEKQLSEGIKHDDTSSS